MLEIHGSGPRYYVCKKKKKELLGSLGYMEWIPGFLDDLSRARDVYVVASEKSQGLNIFFNGQA